MNGNAFRLIPIGLGLLAVLFMAARGCQEGPFGRKQIINITPDQELRLGKQAYQQILSQSKVVNDRDDLPTAVRRIGARLADASKNSSIQQVQPQARNLRFEWEYHVVFDRSINAFCLPGGKVVVNTGIIEVCDTETGLAVVMGHEIGHAIARHGVERMSRAQLSQIGLTAASFSLGDLDPGSRHAVMAALGMGARVGVELPFSRDNESEADRIGVLLMAVAGYDPEEAPKFWDRMSRATGGSKGSDFLSTHPSHGERKQRLAQLASSSDIRQMYSSSSKPTPDPSREKLPRYGENRPGGGWTKPTERTKDEPKAKEKNASGGVIIE